MKLTDLVPVGTIKGGSSGVVFGTDSVGKKLASVRTTPKPQDVTPKKHPKGGTIHVKNR